MADINIEMLKNKLYPVAKALFAISETLVDASKQHISDRDALTKIRSLMHDATVICSRYRVDKLIEDCEEKYGEWTRNYLGKWVGLEPLEIHYPDCCDGCSNNPKNGGSGICNCTLPYMQNPDLYNTGDSYMANNIDGRVYFAENIDVSNEYSANADRIADAVERIEKYMRK